MAVNVGLTTTWALRTENGRFAYSSGVVQNGLIMNLDFSKPLCYPARFFTESSTTTFDLTNQNINGTLIGNPTYNTQNGGYFSFNGTSQYIRGPIPQANLSDQTVQLWVDIQNLTQTRPLLGFGSSNFGPWFLQLQNPNEVQVGRTSVLTDNNFFNNRRLNYFERPATTGWKFISVVKGTTLDTIMYENISTVPSFGSGGGTNQATTQNFTFISAAPIPTLFANDPPQFGQNSIAHVMVYNRKLTLAEITQNYNATKSRFGL
jgi:hypothetical protein